MKTTTRRVLRSIVQFVILLAALLPVVLPELGVEVTAKWYAGALAVAAVVTRIMQAPAAQPFLRWLGLDVQDGQ